MYSGPDWPSIAGRSDRSVRAPRPTGGKHAQRDTRTCPALDTDSMPWIPTGPGKSFRPLRFAVDGWSELMRLEPGSAVPLHRHSGEVHAFNISGTREILGSGELVGPGHYVYEPAGTVDGWGAVGDEPCVVHIKVAGTIEYLNDDGRVIESAGTETQRAVYLA
jgi:2,4'-dihydroxyacetophenone dioxygenase